MPPPGSRDREPEGNGADPWLGRQLWRRLVEQPGVISRATAVTMRLPTPAGAGLAVRLLARRRFGLAYLGRDAEVMTASALRAPEHGAAGGDMPGMDIVAPAWKATDADAEPSAASAPVVARSAHRVAAPEGAIPSSPNRPQPPAPVTRRNAPVIQRRAVQATEPLGMRSLPVTARPVALGLPASAVPPGIDRSVPVTLTVASATPGGSTASEAPPADALRVAARASVAADLPMVTRNGLVRGPTAFPLTPARPIPPEPVRRNGSRPILGAPLRSRPAAASTPLPIRSGDEASAPAANGWYRQRVVADPSASARQSDVAPLPLRGVAIDAAVAGSRPSRPLPTATGAWPQPSASEPTVPPRSQSTPEPRTSPAPVPIAASHGERSRPAARDIGPIAERVYQLLTERLANERRRRGI